MWALLRLARATQCACRRSEVLRRAVPPEDGPTQGEYGRTAIDEQGVDGILADRFADRDVEGKLAGLVGRTNELTGLEWSAVADDLG